MKRTISYLLYLAKVEVLLFFLKVKNSGNSDFRISNCENEATMGAKLLETYQNKRQNETGDTRNNIM